MWLNFQESLRTSQTLGSGSLELQSRVYSEVLDILPVRSSWALEGSPASSGQVQCAIGLIVFPCLGSLSLQLARSFVSDWRVEPVCLLNYPGAARRQDDEAQFQKPATLNSANQSPPLKPPQTLTTKLCKQVPVFICARSEVSPDVGIARFGVGLVRECRVWLRALVIPKHVRLQKVQPKHVDSQLRSFQSWSTLSLNLAQ